MTQQAQEEFATWWEKQPFKAQFEDVKQQMCNVWVARGDSASSQSETVTALMAERNRLQAEVERLRESLEQICTNYNCASFASEERGKKIDQLRAEVETLRNPDAATMLEISHAYWNLRRKAGESGAVKWIQDEQTGALLVFTRGEYREMLMSTVLSIDSAMSKEAGHD